jgi:DNA-binding Xre family transcriptional regulator
MSYNIANVLNQILNEKDMKAAELARASGVTQAQLSRLRSGEQVWINPKDMSAIANALAGEHRSELPKIHARLLYAHLCDECTGLGAKLISIELKSAPKSKSSESRDEPILPPRCKENLDVIAEHITQSRYVKNFIENLSEMCRANCFPH